MSRSLLIARVTMRATLALVAWAALGLSSCSSPSRPVIETERPVAIDLDSEAGPSRVTLYSTVRYDTQCIDFGCAIEPYVADRLDVLQSTTGPDRGYVRVTSRHQTSGEPIEIAELENERPLWFLLMAYDASGRPLATSKPIMTAPGPIQEPATSHPIAIWFASTYDWDPDGRSIVFASAASSSYGKLIRLDVATGQQTPLTQPMEAQGSIVDVGSKRDGSAIAFAYSVGPSLPLGGCRIWVRSSQDGASRPVSSGGDRHPAWGGNRWLYFARYDEAQGRRDVWRVDPDVSGSEARVTPPSGISGNAISVRSSDDRIVDWTYSRGHGALYTLDPENGSLTWLTEGNAWHDSHPAWAPDGRSVLFTSNRSGHFEVWSIDVASQALAQITRTPRGTYLESPRWSPSGASLSVLRLGPAQRLEIYASGITDTGRPAASEVASR